MESEILNLAKELISKESITPLDEGCQPLIANRLSKMGFQIHALRFQEVENLWAIRGKSAPLFAFAGHTDVVPTGNLAQWIFPPFVPTTLDGVLYGRGAADMKGSLAAMVVATEQFLKKHPSHKGSLAFLLTSDEEGPAEYGTKKVIEYLKEQGVYINYCIVGEPTSHQQVGDTLKIGRRGTMHGLLKVIGKQGHVAYPHRALNPIHQAMPAFVDLVSKTWDSGNHHFPATSFQISNMNAGTGAGNVIPGSLECLFNFRFSTESTPQGLQDEVKNILDKHRLAYELNWQIFGHPFLTDHGKLIEACRQAIEEVQGIKPSLSTDGGTSDGRFIAPMGTEVIELGPCNSTIHAVNECVRIDELEALSIIYQKILEKILI